jgi:hypothetical protein
MQTPLHSVGGSAARQNDAAHGPVHLSMLLGRQKLLLAMLDSQESRIAGSDYQNLLFLYTREFEQVPSYDFVPCAEGRFSFTVRADAGRSLARGLLLQEGAQLQLEEPGREVARSTAGILRRTAYFNEYYRDLRGVELIARVLAVSGDDPQARRISSPGLWTIGYEGKSLERYLNQLLQAGITLLCDVRRNAFSHKYGFSKSTLRAACESMGIRYEHLPQLGIASERRRQLAGDHELLFADYVRHGLPQQQKLLVLIERWIRDEAQRVALTCFEADPAHCHRHCVADVLARDAGLTPTHL